MLVSACGQLSRPAMTRIPGADRFKGPIFHTARWDHDVELDGKRVAVIGTGASTIQVVPGDRRPRGAARRLPALGAVRDPQEGPSLHALGAPPLPLVPAGAPAGALHPVALLRDLHLAPSTSSGGMGRLGVRMFERNLDDQISDPGAEARPDAGPRARLQAGADLARLLLDPRAARTSSWSPQGVRELTEERRGGGGRHRAPGRRDRPLDRVREHPVPRADGDPRTRTGAT